MVMCGAEYDTSKLYRDTDTVPKMYHDPFLLDTYCFSIKIRIMIHVSLVLPNTGDVCECETETSRHGRRGFVFTGRSVSCCLAGIRLSSQ